LFASTGVANSFGNFIEASTKETLNHFLLSFQSRFDVVNVVVGRRCCFADKGKK
jgi:hypothetical protein